MSRSPTPPGSTPAPRRSSPQDIAALKKRYEELQTQKTRAETRLESAQQDLQKLKKEAREIFGTDDLAALKAQLESRTQENETRRAAYQESLEKIETDLQAVETRYEASKGDDPS